MYSDIQSDHFIGVCYGPFREGQRPGGPFPSEQELLEDLRIIARHFPIIRMYASREVTPAILRLIEEHDMDIRVVVGAWLACEHAEDLDHITPEIAAVHAKTNRTEVLAATALANKYPGVVAAVCIGNETQVSWSQHRLRRDALARYIDLARDNTRAPITVADDSAVWTDPDSVPLANTLDFLIVHIYAAWQSRQLGDAIEFTAAKLEDVRTVHPNARLVLGEVGWPTSVASSGEQSELILGTVGEREQSIFTRQLVDWSRASGTPVFIFEAFDEPWKGGKDPAEVEKHWGLYNVDRSAKPAVSVLPVLSKNPAEPSPVAYSHAKDPPSVAVAQRDRGWHAERTATADHRVPPRGEPCSEGTTRGEATVSQR